MTSSVNAPLMSGDEIVVFIEKMESKMPFQEWHRFSSRNDLADYGYSIDRFPEEIRISLVERIVKNGPYEALAIRRLITSTTRGYTALAIYLQAADAFLKINSHGEPLDLPYQTAQTEIAALTNELGIDSLSDYDYDPKYAELVIAAKLADRFKIAGREIIKHDYHVRLELLRKNFPSILSNLTSVLEALSSNHKFGPDVATGVAVCVGRNPEFNPERLVQAINERGRFDPELIDILLASESAPLDSGML